MRCKNKIISFNRYHQCNQTLNVIFKDESSSALKAISHLKVQAAQACFITSHMSKNNVSMKLLTKKLVFTIAKMKFICQSETSNSC